MKYMTVYVEVVSAGPGVSDDEIRSVTTSTLDGIALRSRDGCIVGRVVHAQVTEGPKPTYSGASPRKLNDEETR